MPRSLPRIKPSTKPRIRRWWRSRTRPLDWWSGSAATAGAASAASGNLRVLPATPEFPQTAGRKAQRGLPVPFVFEKLKSEPEQEREPAADEQDQQRLKPPSWRNRLRLNEEGNCKDKDKKKDNAN